MIKVNIKKNHIEIKGHDMYDDYGKDIVCASISSIAITTVNAILRLDEKALKYREKDGFLIIDVLKESEQTNTLILNMIELIKELEKEYPKNIKVNEEVH